MKKLHPNYNNFEKFYEHNDIKNCISLQMRIYRLTEVYDEMFGEKNILLNGEDPAVSRHGSYLTSFNEFKKITNITLLENFSLDVIMKSYIKSNEIFIADMEKKGQKIFLATDCPITQNYLLDKYSNIFVYEKMNIH